MAPVTDVTIGATSTSILTAAMWKTMGGPAYLKNESDTIVVLTIAGADDYDLDPGEPLQVIPGQIVTGTAVGGSKKLQIIAGIVPANESAAKGPGVSAANPSYVSAVITAGASALPAGGAGMWSVNQGDFTAAWLSAGSLTLGTFPTPLGTPISGDFFMVVQTLASGEQIITVPTDSDMTLTGQVLAVTGAAFVSGSTFDVFLWGPPRGYDASTNSDQGTRLNPEWAHVDTQQEVASGQTDGTANDYYIDMEYYNEITIQIVDTPGVAGTNTYTIEASATNDGTAEASCDYDDVGSALFGAATYTASAFIPASKDFRAKYIHINVTRTGDAANSDGAWTLNILLGNS